MGTHLNHSTSAMKHFIKNILILIGAYMIAPTTTQASENRTVKKPNILLIMADDLGFGDLSIMGGTDVQSPNIDQLFLEGLTFTDFYANSALGSPTRASLLTGKYPGLVGVPGSIGAEQANSCGHLNCDSTLASLFQTTGYTTALIGKWDLGFESPNLPNEKGFDLFMGFLGDKMDDYYTHLHNGKNFMRFNNNEINPPGHATDLFSDWAADFIRREETDQKPFFLYVAYNAPGSPVQPPEDWLGKVTKRQPGLNLNRAKNIGAIEHMDAGIGRIIDALDETNQLKNTIILFSSDNGGSYTSGASNGVLRGGKQDLYEGGIRVPACLFWKGKIKKGSTCQQIAMTMDIYPTLCQLVELPLEASGIDGKSLAGCIYKGEPSIEDRTLFWVCLKGNEHKGQACYAVRKGPYKMVQNHPDEDFSLYNLTTDPHERMPLSKSSEYYKSLYSLLIQHIQENQEAAGEGKGESSIQ
jgi:arylsulfatase A-like enzyme